MSENTEKCPYHFVAPTARWRHAVAELPAHEIDPHSGETAPFHITSQTKIMTAGSCFAQHLSNALLHYGFDYVNAEPGPSWLTTEERKGYNYGTFSARYGNIYTPRQLLQLAQRSLNLFEPQESAWATTEANFLDPFRPNIQPRGFSSVAELSADRASHLQAVKDLLQNMDVLIFTLGLTESWLSKVDGAVFPLCPGCPHGTFDSNQYEFHNFNVQEMVDDLSQFLKLLAELNPSAKVILTVSPVPLIATMEKKHVLPATVASKSALRAAADEICRKHANVAYFASYEIVQHTFMAHEYFAADRRSVTPDAVDHVMQTFFRFFAPQEKLIKRDPHATHSQPIFVNPICDEEQLAAALGQARTAKSEG